MVDVNSRVSMIPQTPLILKLLIKESTQLNKLMTNLMYKNKGVRILVSIS